MNGVSGMKGRDCIIRDERALELEIGNEKLMCWQVMLCLQEMHPPPPPRLGIFGPHSVDAGNNSWGIRCQNGTSGLASFDL